MRRGFAVGAAVLAALLSAAPATAQTELRLGHVAQANHPWQWGMERFREMVEKGTEGRVRITIFPARQLGDDRQLLENARLGVLEAALISSSTFSAYTPVMDALQLPWLIPTYEVLGKAVATPEAQALLDHLAEMNLKGLGYHDSGLRHFLAVRKPVMQVADFQGLKTRVAPTQLHIDVWKAVGTRPTPMAYGEIYSALETGVLDAVEMNIPSIFHERHYEKAKHLTLTSHYFWPGILVVSMPAFDKLSPEDQKVLVEAGRQSSQEEIRLVAEGETETLEKLKAAGVGVHELADMEEMRTTVKPVSDEYEAKHPLIQSFANKVREIR